MFKYLLLALMHNLDFNTNNIKYPQIQLPVS